MVVGTVFALVLGALLLIVALLMRGVGFVIFGDKIDHKRYKPKGLDREQQTPNPPMAGNSNSVRVSSPSEWYAEVRQNQLASSRSEGEHLL